MQSGTSVLALAEGLQSLSEYTVAEVDELRHIYTTKANSDSELMSLVAECEATERNYMATIAGIALWAAKLKVEEAERQRWNEQLNHFARFWDFEITQAVYASDPGYRAFVPPEAVAADHEAREGRIAQMLRELEVEVHKRAISHQEKSSGESFIATYQ